MLEKFIKSLGFLGIDASNVNNQPDEKLMFKFEDENIDKHWRCFYDFYKLGMKDVYDAIGVMAVQRVTELSK